VEARIACPMLNLALFGGPDFSGATVGVLVLGRPGFSPRPGRSAGAWLPWWARRTLERIQVAHTASASTVTNRCRIPRRARGSGTFANAATRSAGSAAASASRDLSVSATRSGADPTRATSMSIGEDEQAGTAPLR
jgi:hypothetical protein